MNKARLSIQDVRVLHQSGKLKEAEKGYLAILADNPNEITVLHSLALLYIEQKEFEQAQDYLEKAIKLAPKDPVLYLHLANVLKAKGLFSQAVQILQDVIKNNPNLAPAYNNLGTVYYAQAKLREAVEAYQAAIDIQPNYVDAYYNLGLAQSKLKNREEALNAYRAVIELAHQHAGSRFQMGCILMEQSKYQAAIEQFSFIEQDHPFHFETQSNIATCYFKLGKLDEAMLHYLQALDLNPKDVQILFNLGVINMQSGRVSDAIQYYSQALQINPDLYDVQNNLAFAYLALKQNENALRHFREALRLEPKNEAIRHTINILTGDKNIAGSPPEYVRSLFDSYADHFDAHLRGSLRYQVPEKLYQAMQEYVKEAHFNILDLGCGTGLCGELFKKHAKVLSGVDISAKMLEIAAKKNIYDELIQADILPFLETKKEVYDLIIAGDVLVYFGDLSNLFSAIYAALKSDGFFVFNAEIDEKENYQISSSGRFTHNKRYLDELATKNNFKIVNYETIPMRTQEKSVVYGHMYVLKRI